GGAVVGPPALETLTGAAAGSFEQALVAELHGPDERRVQVERGAGTALGRIGAAAVLAERRHGKDLDAVRMSGVLKSVEELAELGPFAQPGVGALLLAVGGRSGDWSLRVPLGQHQSQRSGDGVAVVAELAQR